MDAELIQKTKDALMARLTDQSHNNNYNVTIQVNEQQINRLIDILEVAIKSDVNRT